MTVEEDGAQVYSQETAAMKKELAWLLQSQFPAALAELNKTVHEAYTICSSTDASKLSTLAVTSTNETIKGYITLSGPSILKGELNIKFPHYNRGYPLRFQVNPQKAIILPQLQEIRNSLILVAQHIDEIQGASLDKISLFQTLNKVHSKLTNAKSNFSPSTVAIFPDRGPEPKSFQPELPEDFIIEFVLNKGNIVANVYAVTFAVGGLGGGLGGGFGKVLSKFKQSGKHLKYKTRPIEILDEVTVESPSPRLLTLLTCLNRSEEIVREWKSRLQCFI